MTFAAWLDTFVAEKGIDTEALLEVEGASGLNIIPVCVVLSAMKAASAREQGAIKAMIVRIDFANRPVLPYFKHLAQAIAI